MLRARLLAFSVFAAFTAGCGAPPPPAPVKPLAPPPPKVAPPAAYVAPLVVDAIPEILAAGDPAAAVVRHCEGSLRAAEAARMRVVAAKGANETLAAWDDISLALRNTQDVGEFLAAVHPDAKVREAAKTCGPTAEAFTTKLHADEAVRAALAAVPLAGLDAETTKLVTDALRDFKRNGAGLDAAAKAKLATLNDAIAKKAQDFEQNLGDSTLSVDATPKELEGLPAAWLASHPVGSNGKVRVTTNYPDAFPVFQYAKDRAFAKTLFIQFDNRAAEKNVTLLEEILALRAEKAKLLGYPNWAAYVEEPRMAHDPARVHAFLDGIRKSVDARVKTELADIEVERKGLKIPKDAPLYAADRTFYEDRIREGRFGVDSKLVSKYFEVGGVKRGILEITGDLFGLDFRPVKTATWATDVEPYEVVDRKTQQVLGRFYFDLHPREGKYKHAAVFGIRTTKTLEDPALGKPTRLLPIAAIVCNFPKSTKDSPGLMSHQEVTTFFHEFGHVLHHLLGTSRYATFGGTEVARDFVEAPSQMLEEWAWSAETLVRFAKHYETGEPIPLDLVRKMRAARSVGRGLTTQRQLFLATLDLTYHEGEPTKDSTALLKEVWAKTMPYAYLEGTHFQGTFGHLMGYDAGYYGYAWALAIARDLFSRFEKEGMMNPATAADYRAKVIGRGGSAEPDVLLKDFLGRPFNDAAFQAYLAERPAIVPTPAAPATKGPPTGKEPAKKGTPKGH